MFIINAPLLFSGVWAIVKPWIDEKTRQKIKIIGSNYQKELHQVIDPENLPEFLGGKVPESDYGKYIENEQGPWVGLENQTQEEEDTSKPEEGKESDEQQQEIDDLKKALSGMNFGGGGGKKKKNPYEDDDDGDVANMGDQKFYVNDTPLNTQIDDRDDN